MMGNRWRRLLSGSQMRSPMMGCLFITMRSLSVSRPALLMISLGMPILPMSCSTPPWRSASGLVVQPGQAPHFVGQRADALGMAFRVRVLRLDGIGEREDDLRCVLQAL